MRLAYLLAPPGEMEAEAGARGELMVARIRLFIVLLLLPIPLLNAIELPHWENLVGATVVGVAMLAAILLHRATTRDPLRAWLGPVSTASDITLITLALSTFLVFGQPMTATNSFVLFGVYYIAILATALRHDPRLSLLAGVLAVGQYALLVTIAATGFDLMEEGAASVRYGTFSWGTQVSRMILLTAASALATAVVLRQRELLHRSSIDTLTSLYNRGSFEERLASEATRSRRYAHPLSVAMVDIDHFKRINDGFGHVAGDEALVQFADALRGEFRQTDLVARWGGEEFVVMMPETPPDAATAKLERLGRRIADRLFRLSRGGAAVHITVSAGVAGVPGDLEDPAGLLEVADARLIVAKRNGRNRVVGVGSPVPELA